MADDLIAGKHSPRRLVQVVSKRLVNVLSEPVDVTGRQTSGERQELAGQNRSADRRVPSVQHSKRYTRDIITRMNRTVSGIRGPKADEQPASSAARNQTKRVMMELETRNRDAQKKWFNHKVRGGSPDAGGNL